MVDIFTKLIGGPIKKAINFIITQKVIIAWFVICFIILILALLNTYDKNTRRLFSDQAAHISAALSIWHDGDLHYTLKDLCRFRDLMPAETGPRGLFLKTNQNGDLYYAKPFLYALFAAPFVGLFSLNGFTVLNILCFFFIGLVFLRIFLPVFGSIYSSLIVCGFMIFSPYLAWVPIAHPDLFIAALISTGGFFVLKSKDGLSSKIFGSFILGMALYEKITFLVVLPFLCLLIFKNSTRKIFLVQILLMIIGFLIPTIINLSQDGNFLAYQGHRIYLSNPPFPLEEGWTLPKLSITDHVFSLWALGSSLIGNILLLPHKFVDFFIGRQTGIVLYFPVACTLLFLLFSRIKVCSFIILMSLFTHLCVLWLSFPTNGYGGAGTYGSRYLMQVLPLIPLCFLFYKKYDFNNNRARGILTSFCIFLGLVLSILFQYQVLPPSERLVLNPSLYFNSKPAKYFPFENSLLRTIEQIMPPSFREADISRRNIIYRTGFDQNNGYFLEVNDGCTTADFVLYQTGPLNEPPMLNIFSNQTMILNFLLKQNKIKEIEIKAKTFSEVGFDEKIFGRSFFDLSRRTEIRWRKVKLHACINQLNKLEPPGIIYIGFANRHLPLFQNFGTNIFLRDFHKAGIQTLIGWSYHENWGVWSDGNTSILSVYIGGRTEKLFFDFDVHAYIPPESPQLTVNVLVNGKNKDTWKFVRDSKPPNTKFFIEPEDITGDYVYIGFDITNPRSPMELGRGHDNRKLGLGLRSIRVDKNKGE